MEVEILNSSHPTMNQHPSKKAKSTTTTNRGYQVPWIEKYRPQTLADVVGNEDTVDRLQAISEDGNLPNLILSGPPGCGKVRRRMVVAAAATTSVAFGCQTYREACHFLSLSPPCCVFRNSNNKRPHPSTPWPVSCSERPTATPSWN
jgi:hypothetical protein